MENKLEILHLSPVYAVVGHASFDKESKRHVIDEALEVIVDRQMAPPSVMGGQPQRVRMFTLQPMLGHDKPARVYVPATAAMCGPLEVTDPTLAGAYAGAVDALTKPAEPAPNMEPRKP